jgi:hypothetical protein
MRLRRADETHDEKNGKAQKKRTKERKAALTNKITS